MMRLSVAWQSKKNHLPLTVLFVSGSSPVIVHRLKPSPNTRISEECYCGRNVAKSRGCNAEEEKKKHFFPPSVKKKKRGQKSGIPFCVKQKIMHSHTQTHTFLQCNQSWIVSIECTNFTLMGWNMMAAWGWCAVMETMSGAGAEGGRWFESPERKFAIWRRHDITLTLQDWMAC